MASELEILQASPQSTRPSPAPKALSAEPAGYPSPSLLLAPRAAPQEELDLFANTGPVHLDSQGARFRISAYASQDVAAQSQLE